MLTPKLTPEEQLQSTQSCIRHHVARLRELAQLPPYADKPYLMTVLKIIANNLEQELPDCPFQVSPTDPVSVQQHTQRAQPNDQTP